jgi:hypothetical protein
MLKSVKVKLLLVFIVLSVSTQAQNVKLNSIDVNSYGQIVEYRFFVHSGYDDIILVLNGDGFVKGLELAEASDQQDFEYYDEYEEIELRSKLKKIGNTDIKYYSTFEVQEKEGRISEIGRVKIDYYTIDPDKASRVYSIGNVVLKYYIRSQHYSLAGKMSSINDLEFDYFTNTVETEKIGKIMTIGNYSFDYYTEYDSPSMIGKLKEVEGEENGFRLRVINLL